MTTNLEYYRKQAKALLKAAKSGDPAATERIQRYSQELALNAAQLTIAREQGFTSWARFRQFILRSRLDDHNQVVEFISAATSDLKQAEEILAQHPDLARAGFYVALVLGDREQVREALAESPALAKEKSGPENVEPLVYVCFSRYASGPSPRARDLAETARILLAHGADPNTVFNDPRWKENPLPCLYAATGLNNNPDLGRVLLEGGAKANDGESLYHSTEHPDHACLRLLLEYGATPHNNEVKHVLDVEDEEGLRLLMAAGADLNEGNVRGETALHWAIFRRRSPEIVAMLLDNGADVNARRKDGRTAYALARESAQPEIEALLVKRGAATELPPLDRYLEACVAATPDELERLLQDVPPGLVSPEDHRMLPDFAVNHSTIAVRALLAAGVPVDARGENGGTALHWACWKGYPDLVKLLLAHGASLTIEDTMFHAPPPGWFGHGVQNCCEPGSDYAQVARELIAAGAEFLPADFPSGNEAVDQIVRQRGPRNIG